jgi:hypothetical protein
MAMSHCWPELPRLLVEKHFPHIASINDLLNETPLNDAMVTAKIEPE